MAQELCTWKTINSVSKNILWGQSSRIGKTYMIGGVIIMDSKEKDTCNYLIITTAINETASQYHEVFDNMQFIGFNVKTLKQETEKEIKQLIKTRNEENLKLDAKHKEAETTATYRYGIRNDMVVKVFLGKI